MTDSTLESFDVCIVGAGIIGLAIARAVAMLHEGGGRRVLLLEKNAAVGQETSSRNSEVIHAGLYYPAGSLKARLCLPGRQQLYHYCEQYDIPFRRTGKLIVSSKAELPVLEGLLAQGLRNGLAERELQLLDKQQLQRKEPALDADYALFSESTGIMDSHQLMSSLQQQAESHGVCFVPWTRVRAVECSADGFEVHAVCGPAGTESYRFHTRQLVNSAGLYAAELATAIRGLDPAHLPKLKYYKGNYFSYAGASPFRHLVYPLPDRTQRGLGIHATLDMAGGVRFGPDIEAPLESVDHFDYRVNEARKQDFATAVKAYYPALSASRLQPGYAGYRPRLSGGNPEGFSDFVIQDETVHGLPGLVQLFAIDSPGLTASMALADEVVSRLSGTAEPVR